MPRHRLFAPLAALALVSLGACASLNTTDPVVAGVDAINDVGALAQSIAADGTVTAVGTFTGDSDHITTGAVAVSLHEGQWLITLSDEFSLDGAPDPKVALGTPDYDPNSILGELQMLEGRQVYVLPAGLNIGNYDRVWIWCEEFNVPLGHADLSLI
ncbi:MAG: DM13 domain-containing protein [Pseudomonadota bacterium]